MIVYVLLLKLLVVFLALGCLSALLIRLVLNLFIEIICQPY